MFLRPARHIAGCVRSSAAQSVSRIQVAAISALHARSPQSIKKGNDYAIKGRSMQSRILHTTQRQQIDILADADKPHGETKQSEPHHHTIEATPLTDTEYQTKADEYMEQLLVKLQNMEEQGDISDVEYSAGVLRVETSNHGIYVLNKQPPNKQIWLSSPISGPKRFDWVVLGESMHQKEGSGSGDWIYVRDGSSLSRLLKKELRVEMDEPHDMPEGAR